MCAYLLLPTAEGPFAITNYVRRRFFDALRLVSRERSTTIDILLHLNEIDRRGLHLKLGYGSLSEYCTGHLKYSSSAGGRRVQVARCIKRHPEVLDLLRSGEANLSTISLVAPVLDDRNKTRMLREIRNRSQREVDALVSGYRPPLALRDRVKPVRVIVSESKAAERAQQESTRPRPAHGDRTPVESRSGILPGAKPTHCVEQKLLIQFLADKDFMKKYEEVRSLLSNRLSDTSFEKVFEALIVEFLERHSPDRKKARREKRKAAENRKPLAPRHANARNQSTRSRNIPAAVRDKVWARDGGRCSYVGKNGKQCESTHALQVDHIEPFARGGQNNASNLRLLCAKHNRLVAEEVYGVEFMERFQRKEYSRE